MAREGIAGSRILIVEDEYYVADDLRSLLGGSGVEVVGPVPTADDARAMIAGSDRLDAVLLDINLRGDMAYDLADELAAGQVPFAFVTGYDRSVLPDRFAQSHAVRKPVEQADLETLLSTLLRPAASPNP